MKLYSNYINKLMMNVSVLTLAITINIIMLYIKSVLKRNIAYVSYYTIITTALFMRQKHGDSQVMLLSYTNPGNVVFINCYLYLYINNTNN